MVQNNLAIYTVVMGGDYDLPPTRPQIGVDYICFTDQQDLHVSPNGWTIRDVDPILPSDTFRSSREMKTRAHRWLADYSGSIYIDCTVHLRKDPQELWDYLIPDQDTVFGAFFHSYRDTVAEEFMAVSEANLDFRQVIDAQMQAYTMFHPKTLEEKPVWGGVLARRHNETSCVEAMEVWFSHILRYSRRDQLSLPLALSSLSREQRNIRQDDIHLTDFHQWPVSEKPKPPGYTVSEAVDVSIKGPSPVSASYLSERFKKLRRSLEKRNMLPSQVFGRKTPASTAANPLPNSNVIFGFDDNLGLHFAQDPNSAQRVFVSDQKRLELYKEGIKHRQNWILRDYRLPVDFIHPGDTVIDIGANIGEIGIWVTQSGGKYIAFEPDPIAYSALQHNVPSQDLFDVALSDSDGTAEFYLSTEEADSSLFAPSDSSDVIKVKTARLDTFLADARISEKIYLLKVEAEGMEPEVLAGALETLNHVEYVAVDAGPERGGENTVPGVFNILIGANFEILDCFLLRGTFLFRKKKNISAP
jgi:FkbM family methyltransferase